MLDWVRAQGVDGLEATLHEEEGRTPFLVVTVDATDRTDETVLAYAHLDKQPPLTGDWSEGLGPWKPVIRDGKLYGRGGADDGYGLFAAVLAVKALRLQKVPHARVVIVVEGSEESGSPDLAHYLAKLADVIGRPTLLICLDSGCGDYERMWLTTSLRGITVGTLRVRVTSQGVHSGASSGVIPSTFQIARELLDRLGDSKTGRLIDALHVEVPAQHLEYARDTGRTLGAAVHENFPFLGGVRPLSDDPAELMLNKTWRPTMTVTGVGGIPALGVAGNVLRPETSLKLSIRLPPTADSAACAAAVKETLERDPPFGALVTFDVEKASTGWAAGEAPAWLTDAIQQASQDYFGQPAGYIGEGGSVPFVGALERQFPGMALCVTGVLGPKSNAHGPDEFLSLSQAEGVSCAVASLVAAHHKATAPSGDAKRQRTEQEE